MANITIFSLSNVTWTKEKYLDSYVEGFSKALLRNGNQVQNFRINEFAGAKSFYVDKTKTLEEIKKNKPDLIITFNNVLPYSTFLDDVNCPVACFASDSWAFFSNSDQIRKHADRYYFFNFSHDTINSFPQWFPYLNKDRAIHFGHATEQRAVDINQDINLSFIGSIANWNHDFADYFKSLSDLKVIKEGQENIIKDNFFRELDRFKQDPFSEFKADLPGFVPSIGSIETTAILLLTCKSRFEVLNQLTDLGLKVFSYPYAFSDVLLYNYELFRCFDFELSVSFDHTTKNFNRSKISLNLPHAHAKEGFSWRVCDILASNSLLLSCPQPDLIRLMKGYADLPTYTSPAEARELSKKILADDSWRKELVLASQQMIDDKCRFDQKFKIIEEAIPSLSIIAPVTKPIDMTISIVDHTKCVNPLRFFIFRSFQKLIRDFAINKSTMKTLIKTTLKKTINRFVY